jgi:transmembrane sensor
MDFFNEELFQRLISDLRFIQWARGKEVADETYWNNWKINHPEDAYTFDETLNMVQDITASQPEISEEEIQYLWSQVDSRIQQQVNNSIQQQLDNRIQEQIDIHVQQQADVKRSKVISIWIKAAAACFITALMGYAIWVSISNARIKSAYAQLSDHLSDQMVSVQAPMGTRVAVNLPDGSKVWLNAGSRLSYPTIFKEHERRVHLDGEGFFKVQHNSKVPFIVENAGPEVKVYGTSFNVNAYADENLVTVALVEGKVSLKTARDEQFLKPGQVSYFDKSQSTLTIKDEKIDRFVCWREGKFIFRNTSIDAILRMLQREYNVAIELKDPAIANYRYNATFQYENLEQILELLEFSAPVKCEYIKGRFTEDGSYVKGKVSIYLRKHQPE